MTTDEIMALGGQLVARNVRQLQGLGSEAETRESYVALQSAIEALQADAARYRWLRHGDNDEIALRVADGVKCDPDQHWLLRDKSLDVAIDAAMALDKP